MKSNSKQNPSVTKPLLKSLVDRMNLENGANKLQSPSTANGPVEPAELYQDSGEGYNINYTFPQE